MFNVRSHVKSTSDLTLDLTLDNTNYFRSQRNDIILHANYFRSQTDPQELLMENDCDSVDQSHP